MCIFRSESSIASYSSRLPAKKKKEMAINLGKQLDLDQPSEKPVSTTHPEATSGLPNAASGPLAAASGQLQRVHTSRPPPTSRQMEVIQGQEDDWDIDISDDVLMTLDKHDISSVQKPVNFAPSFNNCSHITINFGSIN